jgi:predicted ATP-dependent endonuclease of OLD family
MARIKSVSVHSLHDQFEVQMELNPGLNIIYGKNGRGKTTLLHILANALELDFERFKYLNFRQITITTFDDAVLTIYKEPKSESPLVVLNNQIIFQEGYVLPDSEVVSLRKVLGDRPTYLPAFRSVLERIRTEAYYREAAPFQGEIDSIEAKEYAALKSAVGTDLRALREEAVTTARKTFQCRQWFGAFIPVVRYPSIMEVEDGLSSEWRVAQLENAQREQNMFADVFVKVFNTVVGKDKPTQTKGTTDLLSGIVEALDGEDYQLGDRHSETIFRALYDAADYLTQGGSQDNKGIERSVLQLYVETLLARKSERKSAFQKSRDFETAVNKFLDRKTLSIGQVEYKARTRTAVKVGTSGGHSYGLKALSSGEKQVLTMLYSASRSRFRNGTFLIDEPELSLHIDWQRQILGELMAQAPDRQIIACTHSPEVGADNFDVSFEFEPIQNIFAQPALFPEEEGEE